MGDDITDDHLDLIRESVILAFSDPEADGFTLSCAIEDCDRRGGRTILPPPAPAATTSAPHGDPGERVVGETLIDVWPGVLHRIMTYGLRAPSKYGDTMECLNLVSVYRNPRGILEDVDRADWLGFDRAGMESYAKRVTTPWAPDDAPYSYGIRIGVDGFSGVDNLLVNKPNDRGIAVSPWTPKDAAGGHGRPCLVWVQFRLLGGALHLQFVFRSHDYFAAYPMNVAALASWLIREADARGLEVGTITCLSVSAHLYDRDWHDARQVIDEHLPKGHQWDPRSTWRVEVHRPASSTIILVDPPTIRATALTPDGVDVIEVFEGRTAEAVQRKIERSGLLTTIGNALWLGRSLAEAEANL
jgi:thymidylate synthase